MNHTFDLRKGSLWPYVLMYVLPLLFFPSFRIFFSSPLLVAALYRLSWIRFLWFGVGAGLFFDLLSSDFPLGFYAAIFCLTSLLLGSLKLRFFSDHLSTLPIMTFFASLFQSIIVIGFIPFFDVSPKINLSWIFTDLFCMPILDAACAFLTFVIVPKICSPLFRFKKSRLREEHL